MSVSQTKNRIISKREGNQFLHAAALLPVQEREMDLSTDHPNFLPDESILDGAIKALEAGETHYVDVPGVPSLRDSIVTFLQESGFANYNQDTVQVTAGMQECRFLSIQNIGDQQPSIALPTVVHPGVHKAVGIRPMKVVFLPVDSRRLLPTIEGIQKCNSRRLQNDLPGIPFKINRRGRIPWWKFSKLENWLRRIPLTCYGIRDCRPG